MSEANRRRPPLGRRRLAWELLLAAALLPWLMLWAHGHPGLADVNRLLYDQLIRAQERVAPSDDIVIVGIDDRSLAALGPWPWSRSVHAQFLTQLAPDAPRSVLFNVFFDTPAPDGADDLLASAMTTLPVYLAMNFVEGPHGAGGFIGPVATLAQAAHGVGHVNASADDDDRVRTLFRYEGTAARLAPYVGLLIASGAQNAAPAAPRFAPDGGWTRLSRFGFRLAGPAGSYRTVSYVDVLQGKLPPETFRGKQLLVGTLSNARLDDRLAVVGTGFRGAGLPGVEVHANAIDALMHRRTIAFPGDRTLLLWIAVPLWLAMALFLVAARHAALGALGLGAVTVCLGTVAMHEAHMALPIATPLAGIASAYVIWSWRRLSALMAFFRRRIDVLNALPAGPFEPAPAASAPPYSLEQRTRSLDRAIERLVTLQATLIHSLAVMPAPVLICRGDGVVGQSNRAARALLTPHAWGRAPVDRAVDALTGSQFFDLLAPLQRLNVVDGAPAAAVTGLPALWHSAVTGEYTTPAGAIFRVQAARVGEAGADAATARWIVVLHDLTRERQAERERAALFSFFSHDLRAPQVSILNLLELQALGDPAVAARDVNAAVAREAHRALTMADSFMTMLEAESTDYRVGAVAIASVAMDALDAVWAYAQKNGVTLREHLTDNEAFVLADGALLMRAIRNLLDNAIRHSPPGSCIDVCVTAHGGDMEDAGGTDGTGEVLLSVRDEGSGMDAERLAQVRSAGHRRAGHGRAHGWGVGLAVVNTVIARHGGWIDMHSSPGAGTQTIIGLPRA